MHQYFNLTQFEIFCNMISSSRRVYLFVNLNQITIIIVIIGCSTAMRRKSQRQLLMMMLKKINILIMTIIIIMIMIITMIIMMVMTRRLQYSDEREDYNHMDTSRLIEEEAQYNA